MSKYTSACLHTPSCASDARARFHHPIGRGEHSSEGPHTFLQGAFASQGPQGWALGRVWTPGPPAHGAPSTGAQPGAHPQSHPATLLSCPLQRLSAPQPDSTSAAATSALCLATPIKQEKGNESRHTGSIPIKNSVPMCADTGETERAPVDQPRSGVGPALTHLPRGPSSQDAGPESCPLLSPTSQHSG